MLKKIALTTLFALSFAAGIAGSVSAHSAPPTMPVPTVPHGFCPIPCPGC
jgi:hypothetical protein